MLAFSCRPKSFANALLICHHNRCRFICSYPLDSAGILHELTLLSREGMQIAYVETTPNGDSDGLAVSHLSIL